MRHKVSRIYSPLGSIAVYYFYVAMVIILVSSLQIRTTTLHIHAAAVWITLGVICALAIFAISYQYFTLWRHNREVIRYAAANHINLGQKVVDEYTYFELMSPFSLPHTRSGGLTNYLKASDWQYSEYACNIMREGKNGDTKVDTVYYAVMATDLPRKLPNVLFDSKQARGKQFRTLFDPRQRHSLEGDFDNYFTTYFPAQYTIDSMSFISPDVMWSMREAAAYDIEIIDDKLFLYGNVYDPAQQLPDMSQKIAGIKQQLLDNILTYRDERLPYDQGRQRVTPLGAALKRRRVISFSLITLVVYIVFRMLLEITSR